MSEEEKKAIDILINEIADIVITEYCTHCIICENEDTECYYTKVIDIVYNLAQKQYKEIEELKEKNNFIIKENLDDKYEEILEKTFNKYIDKNIKENFISKNKIKEKIEEYKRIEEKEIEVNTLQELLEE